MRNFNLTEEEQDHLRDYLEVCLGCDRLKDFDLRTDYHTGALVFKARAEWDDPDDIRWV